MPKPIPKFIYFDLGNVILNFSHEIACRQMGEVAGIAAERVREIVFDGGLEWRYERGEITSREFYDIFCRESGTQPDYDALHLAGSAIFTLNVPIVPLIAHLKGAGNRLGILSNTCEAHWNYCSNGRYTIVNKLFDVYALSYQIGAMKPEPRIYTEAARLAGVQPSEIFFMDDRQDNIDAALAAGYDAVHYTSPIALARELDGRGVRSNY